MSRIEFSFTETFQEQMLSLMTKDLPFAAKVSKYIPRDNLYADPHKYLFDRIKEKAEKGELLSYVEVEEHLKTVERHKRRVIKNFCRQVFSLTIEKPDFIKEGLTDYAKKNAFIDVFQTAQTFWNDRKHDKAYAYTMEGINDLYSINFQDDAAISIEKFEELRQLYIAKSARIIRRVPTGIGPLDDILRGGLEKGELGVLLAEPKKGKSIGLMHMGAHAVLSRSGKVAHFVLEGTTEQTLLRYLSRISGIEYSRLDSDEITTEEAQRVDKLMEKFAGSLTLLPFNKHWKYTVLDIEGKLRELSHAGKKPDLVVVDYADLLNATGKYSDKRHEQTEVYRDLKRLAMAGPYSIWTASQAVRPKEDAEKEYLLRAKDISESFEKVRIADLVATLNQTSREKVDGIVRFHVDIYRSNDTGHTIKMITNFEKMIFYSKKYGHISSEDTPSWSIKRKKK